MLIPFFEKLPIHVVKKMDDDTVAYLTNVIEESQPEGKSALRDATEPFLSESGMSREQLDAFYSQLFFDEQSEQKLKGSKTMHLSPSRKPETNARQFGMANHAAALDAIDNISSPLYSTKNAVQPPASASKLTKQQRRTMRKKLANGGEKSSADEQSKEKKAQQNGAPKIVANSQVSRFHTETLETLSKDVDLKGVNLSVGNLELLADARLLLKAGTHYGLIGKNGVGKSTLLSVIANKSLIGFPNNIRTLYIQQLEVVDDSRSVIDVVLDADTKWRKLDTDARILQAAINKGDSDELLKAVELLLDQQAQDEILEAQKVADHRSGQRGFKARVSALEIEKTARNKVYQRYFTPGSDTDVSNGNKRSVADVAAVLLDELYMELKIMDADSAEARAKEILTNLGISQKQQCGPVSLLSGGWRMRVALAQALFAKPDLLLLDEPTNHLDLPAIIWLRDYLRKLREDSHQQCVVVVSHDRHFLNAVAQEIIVFKDRSLSYHPGNFDDYENSIDELRKKRQRLHDALVKKKEHMEKSIQKALKHAKSSGDDKRLGLVAARRKKLERMGAEKTEDGKRFKLSYRAGFHADYRPQIELIPQEKKVSIKIPDPESLRSNGALVTLDEVSFRYTPTGPFIVSDVSLDIELGSRIAILGANGSGKSTLIQLLKGDLSPTRGQRESNNRATIAHFSQHFVDMYAESEESSIDLLKAQGLPGSIHNSPTVTALQETVPEKDIRSWLGSFGLHGPLAKMSVRSLSGGQKARVALALMLWHRPHLLLLDEITNHLDMQTIDGLIEALGNYSGAVVLVSHDQFFVEQLAEDVYIMDNGKLVYWEDDLDAYAEYLLQKASKKKGPK
ncbi:uncharacterized protein VTP21DRAFT_8875 [Calcarisporiella thermophila]|uniref:uncharacterized protein n=1 Tax=Calcarisporiella thermophila TaxID=911321 RepID=UPI0037428A57